MKAPIDQARIAFVHDWLVTYAGAERVLEQMLQCYPQADLFSVVDFLQADARGFILDKSTTTSFVQKLPFVKHKYRSYLPLMPLAIEQLDVTAYDIVISSSHAVAKGVLTGPNQTHICMCYSPIRYAWDLQHQYLRESGLNKGIRGMIAKLVLHKMRLWDARTPNGVDYFIAISDFIARRIWKTYRRESTIIHPPVDVDRFSLCAEKMDYYLTASRLVPYKRIDLIVDAFGRMPDKKLKVIGDGPEMPKIKRLADECPNIELLGTRPFDALRATMQNARAFVFAAEEDFGIVPVEAQACGTPVIAYNRGGTSETIRGLETEPSTGVFFDSQSSDALQTAIKQFESNHERITPSACRNNALRFSIDTFRARFKQFVDDAIADFYSDWNGAIQKG